VNTNDKETKHYCRKGVISKQELQITGHLNDCWCVYAFNRSGAKLRTS